MLSRPEFGAPAHSLTGQVKAHPELGRRADRSPHTALGRYWRKGGRESRGTSGVSISGRWLCPRSETELPSGLPELLELLAPKVNRVGHDRA